MFNCYALFDNIFLIFAVYYGIENSFSALFPHVVQVKNLNFKDNKYDELIITLFFIYLKVPKTLLNQKTNQKQKEHKNYGFDVFTVHIIPVFCSIFWLHTTHKYS